MEQLNCSLRVIATDYMELSKADYIFEPIEVAEKLGLTADNKVRIQTEILQQFLKSAQKEDNKIVVGRGTVRKKEKIKLYVKFSSNNDNSEIEEDETDYDGLCKEEADELEEENKKISRELSATRIGGIVGAVSGNILIDAKKVGLKTDAFLNCNINLQIKSRMDSKNGYYFISTLLKCTKMQMHNEDVFNNDEDMFDFLLVESFYNDLKVVLPKGFYRTYRRFENNDSRIKGSIDIARHIRNNVGLKNGNIAYSYREYTSDNAFNRLILLAYDVLKRKHPDRVEELIDSDIGLSEYIKGLRGAVTVGCNRINTVINENQKVIAHPYFSEYEQVRKTCLKILRDEGITVFDGNDGVIKGFLFYLPDLWEIFLMDILQNSLVQECEIKDQVTAGYIERKVKSGYSCLARPDFVIRNLNAKNNYMILDAKFKTQWERAFGGTSLAKYCGEDINKCIRDMVVTNSRAAGVIFPFKLDSGKRIEMMKNEELHSRRISKDNQGKFYIIPVGIPSYDDDKESEEYNEWKADFDKRINEFVIKVNNAIRECIELSETN